MRSLIRIIIVLLVALGCGSVPVLHVSATNLDTTADRVFGQADFTHAAANAGGLSAISLSSPAAVALDRQGNLFISDLANNRVLEYNAPLTGGMAANRVFGQDGNFNTNTANSGGISAKSLYHPSGLAVDALGNLYIADVNNNRVLEYDTPLKPGGDTSADRVFGQGGNFGTNTANNGGISAGSLSSPMGVAVDPQGNLYIAEYGNNRVLEYANPLWYDTTADLVFGQGGVFSTNDSNKNGLSADSLYNPVGVGLDALGNLFIADCWNHRVLEYNNPLTGGDTTADRVFGQGGIFTTNTSNKGGISADSLVYPEGVALDAGGNLYVADSSNSRVLEYNTPLALGSNTTADLVFGQAGSFTTNTINNNGLNANSLFSPTGVAVDAWGNLYTADSLNNRSLEYDVPVLYSAPTLTALSPSTVAAGGSAFTLTVNGSGFVPGSVVRWNGIDRPTTYLNSTQLNAAIGAADASADGPFPVTVFTPAPGGGVSAPTSLALYPRATLDLTADGVLGQPNFTVNPANNPLLPGGANRLNFPFKVKEDAHTSRLFVADFYNNRVLSWPDAAALANSQAADLVIGQPDFNSITANTGGISASTLNFPEDTVVDAQGNLYVADFGNHRVLIYPAPLTSGMAAGWVIGQPDFTSKTFNNGGVSRTSLDAPSGLSLDAQDNLYVADFANNRVLEYNSPLTTDLSADRVFGQGGNYTTNTANNGGVNASSLWGPTGLAVDPTGNLFIGDDGNNRVLEYNTPLTADTIADKVFGQPNMTSNTANNGEVSASSLWAPISVTLDAHGNLYVADQSNNRVLEYNTPLKPGSDTIADKVFGQPNMTSNTVNNLGINTSSLKYPSGVVLDARGNLFVADAGNNRVLEYNLPLPNEIAALSALTPSTLAAGGPAFTLMVNGTGFVLGSEVRWGGSPRPTTYISGAQLTAVIPAADVASGGPFPVTVFNPAPGGGSSLLLNLALYQRHNQDVTADGVLGQPNFTANTVNNLLLPGGARSSGPAFVAVDHRSGRLFVTDWYNHRVLSWPSAAAFANSEAADLVLGQPNFLSTLANKGGISASSLYSPYGLAVDGQGNLYVADYGNQRVLVYLAPLTSGMAASKVFGQGGSFTTGNPNNGGISAHSLSFPASVALDGQGNLFVGDFGNHRVLEYNTPLATGGDTTADRVFGQGGLFTSADSNHGGLGANSLSGPFGVAVDAQGNLYVAEFFNHRVLEYDTPLAASGDITADRVFGQGNSMNTATPNKDGISPASLANPVGVAVDVQGNLYVGDSANNRGLEYDTPLAAVGDTSADRVFGQNGNFTTNTTNTGGISASSLARPYGVALDVFGNLLVADYGNNRLLEFDVPVPYAAPTLSGLNPTAGVAGGPEQVIEVVGAKFVLGSVARWNGADLPTEYEDSIHLSVTLPANLLAAAGTAQITVFTPAPGGGLSGPLTFTINHPIPTLTQLSPVALRAGSAASVVTLIGTNFFASSVVRWNGVDLPTTYVDGSHLRATVPANLLIPGSAAITVFNPAPGGGSSGGLTLTITQFQVYLPSVTK